MADAYTFLERGVSLELGSTTATQYTCNATVAPNLIVIADSSGNVGPCTASSLRAVGVSPDGPSLAQYDPINVITGKAIFIADGGGVVAGYPLKCGTAGKACVLIDSTLAGSTLDTSSAGIAFTNQPANDTVTVVSAGAGDTTQTITIIGTTNGADTVVVEEVALNGAVPVDTVKADWGVILAVIKDVATAGTVTITEKSGGLTITTLPAATLSKGMDAVTGTSVATYNVKPVIKCSGASTKQIGLIGTDAAGATIYDSQALNGTTDVTMNTSFRTVTYQLTGDLEATRTSILMLGAEEDDDAQIGWAMETQATDGDTFWGMFSR